MMWSYAPSHGARMQALDCPEVKAVGFSLLHVHVHLEAGSALDLLTSLWLVIEQTHVAHVADELMALL